MFEFPLKRAISETNPATGCTFLTPFRYIPVFVTLDEAETRDYLEKTRRIHASWGPAKNDPEQEAALEALMFARANIVKNAAAKVTRLKEILRDLGDGIRDELVSRTDPDAVLARVGGGPSVIAHKVHVAVSDGPGRIVTAVVTTAGAVQEQAQVEQVVGKH